MKILSIGNSYSQDAQRYLHQLAKNAGEEVLCYNLYVGGCQLKTHYKNMLSKATSYILEFNGISTNFKVSLDQALLSNDWDVITLQQQSNDSATYETFSPYLERIAEHVRLFCPKAKIFLLQTWAYENGSEKLAMNGAKTTKEMFSNIEKSYLLAQKAINSDKIIPCGKAMLNALEFGLEKVQRDTHHASLGAGRYILALTFFKALTGKDISNDTFLDFDEPITEKEREIIIKAVNSAL